MSPGDAVMRLQARSSLSAPVVLSTVSSLNFPRWIISGGPCHLRSGWDIVNTRGAMDKWPAGAEQAFCPVRATGEFRNDTRWRRRALEASPTKHFQNFPSACFAWRPRLPDLKGKAASAGCGAACAVYAAAAGSRGFGASLGDRSFQGSRNRVAMRKGVNWEGLWVMEESRRVLGDLARGRLVLAQMDNATSVAYANHGAGHSPARARVARGIAVKEIALQYIVVALRISCRDVPVADAPLRFTLIATEGGARIMTASSVADSVPKWRAGAAVWARV